MPRAFQGSMDWPQIPIEKIPPDQFQPERCPWPECPSRHTKRAAPFDFNRYGFYRRKGDGRCVPRFLCHACGRTFSQQTFATSYYLKRPELLRHVAQGLVSGQAHRQIARTWACAPSTVTSQAARLGRHAILFHTRCLASIRSIEEEIGYDHFETFGISQYFPLGVGTAIGQDSRFLYSLDAAPHRRKGRMSAAQKARRAKLESNHGRPAGDSYAKAALKTLELLMAKTPSSRVLTLVMDDHRQYPAAVARHPHRNRIRTRIYPNPKRGPKGSPRSPAARQRDRQMATLDHAHQFIRHSCSHHRRETLAFARRHTALLERLFLHTVWLNLIKRRVEDDVRSSTRAMRLGLTESPWSWEQILAQRLMPHEIDLPDPWRELYFRQPRYPAQYERKPHALKRAI